MVYQALTRRVVVAIAMAILFRPGWAESSEVSARLSGTTITTANMDRTVRFYVDLLGFRELRRRDLTEDASRRVFGLGDEAGVGYASLVTTEWSKENPYLSSLNVVAVPHGLAGGASWESSRPPHLGEITLAYRVTGLDAIAKEVKHRDVPVVTPLEDSATGRSRTLTVLDPNGIRIHLYEYLDDDG